MLRAERFLLKALNIFRNKGRCHSLCCDGRVLLREKLMGEGAGGGYLTPAAQPASEGREPCGMRVWEKPARFLPARFCPDATGGRQSAVPL